LSTAHVELLTVGALRVATQVQARDYVTQCGNDYNRMSPSSSQRLNAFIASPETDMIDTAIDGN